MYCFMLTNDLKNRLLYSSLDSLSNSLPDLVKSTTSSVNTTLLLSNALSSPVEATLLVDLVYIVTSLLVPSTNVLLFSLIELNLSS